MDESFAIVNDAALTIRGVITRPKPRGRFPLVILAGGFFHTMQSPAVRELARLLLLDGFVIARFDFTDAFGESDGRAADMTISQRVRDLEHVVQYCKRRGYVNEEKTSILGIGIGAMSALILEAFHSQVQKLILVNTPMAVDRLSWTTFDDRERFRIKLKRYFHVPLSGSPALINYTFFEDAEKIDMARCARNLKTPVLYIVGDSPVVSKDQSEWLHERTSGKKRLLELPIGEIDGKKGVKLVVDEAVKFLRER